MAYRAAALVERAELREQVLAGPLGPRCLAKVNTFSVNSINKLTRRGPGSGRVEGEKGTKHLMDILVEVQRL